MNTIRRPGPAPSLERILSLAPEPDHHAGVDAEAGRAYDALEELEVALQALRDGLDPGQREVMDEALERAAGLWDAMADLHLSSIGLADDLVAWGRDWRRVAEPGLPRAVRVRYAIERANARTMS